MRGNMELLDIIKLRKSIRSFQKKKIDRQLMLEILEAGRLAPSACNFQPWQFIVVDEPSVLRQIREAYPRDWFAGAPQVIVICGKKGESWKRPVDRKDHCDIDVAIATDHITLMAASKGLGSCWVCNFNPAKVSEALQLPEDMEPIVLLPIGYPVESPEIEEKKRKNPDEVITYNNTINNL